MSILLNLNFKTNKKLIFVLANIYGLGFCFSQKICNSLGYDYNIRVNKLKERDINKLNALITAKYKFVVDAELIKEKHDNIELKKNIKCYQGIRHLYGLPVNGQRTHTNAKTRG
jgi:small subunit ribosomal protein S13